VAHRRQHPSCHRGYNIHDIAETLTYEQVVYLLWHGELPSADQLHAFNADLIARRGIPSMVIDLQMPASAHPMAGLRGCVASGDARSPGR
jgi:citrate synthase